MKKSSGILLALCMTLSAAGVQIPARGAVPHDLPRHLEGIDLLSLEAASAPRISPDGKLIAYVRRSADVTTDSVRSTIWLITVATGKQVPLSGGSASQTNPQWSPDGKRIAYVSDAEGAAQLFVRWLDSGAVARITGLPDAPASIAWSPDGTRIAYITRIPEDAPKLGAAPIKPEGAKWAPALEVVTTMTYRIDARGYVKPGFDHVFHVSAEGGAPIQLTFGSFDAGGPLSWSRDGRSIIFSADRSKDWERSPGNTEIYKADLASGMLTALTTRMGADYSPAVSPDGRKIAYLGFDDKRMSYENVVLYVMDVDGGNVKAVTGNLDRTVQSPVWSKDGRTIFVQYDDRGTTRVARVLLDGTMTTVAQGLVQSELDRPYTGGEFSVSDNGLVAFTSGSTTRPADISVANGKSTRQLTQLNADLLGRMELAATRKIAVTAPDKQPIDAWLITPPGFDPAKRYPLILEIHGGPFAAYGPSFSTDNQLYAAAGYAVLSVNPRGSTSYGYAFANLLHHDFPGGDYEDLMAAVDAAIADGHVDADNMFVTGGSGGGILSAWIVGKTNRFRAAASQKPAANWASQVLTTDIAAFVSKYWFANLPWEDPSTYWSKSPLSLVGHVKTPTLLVAGTEDYRTHISEAEQYYTALKLAGVPTALVRVPGASHHWLAGRPSQSAARVSAILAWFENYRIKSPVQ